MNKKRTLLLIGAILAMVLALGVTSAFAQEADEPDTETESEVLPLPGRGGHHGFGGRGMLPDGVTSREELLANALGLTVEELQAARDEAHAAALAEMVEAGYLTQEEADLIQAVETFQRSIDRDALMAEALGISVDELQAAREDGTTLPELMDELDLTMEEVTASKQAAYEAAVEQAVTGGTLTQEQADQILSGEAPGLGHGFRGFDGGFVRGHGHGRGPADGLFSEGTGFTPDAATGASLNGA